MRDYLRDLFNRAADIGVFLGSVPGCVASSAPRALGRKPTAPRARAVSWWESW